MKKILGSDAAMTNEEFLGFASAMNAELTEIAQERGMPLLASKLRSAAEHCLREVNMCKVTKSRHKKSATV